VAAVGVRILQIERRRLVVADDRIVRAPRSRQNVAAAALPRRCSHAGFTRRKQRSIGQIAARDDAGNAA